MKLVLKLSPADAAALRAVAKARGESVSELMTRLAEVLVLREREKRGAK